MIAASSLLTCGRPVLVPPELSLRDLAICCRDRHVGAVVVVRDGTTLGLVTERDVVLALADGADPDAVWAADVMDVEPVTVGPDTRIDAVLALMAAHGIRHVPVQDGPEVYGVLTLAGAASTPT